MSQKAYITLAVATLLGASFAGVNANNQLYAHTLSVFSDRADFEIIDAPAHSIRRHAHRTHYPKCRFEQQERWSRRRGATVMRNIKVCN